MKKKDVLTYFFLVSLSSNICSSEYLKSVFQVLSLYIRRSVTVQWVAKVMTPASIRKKRGIRGHDFCDPPYSVSQRYLATLLGYTFVR